MDQINHTPQPIPAFFAVAQLQTTAMPMVAAVGMPNVQYLMMPGVAGAAPYQVALSATPYGTQLAPNHGMAGFGQGSMLPTQQFNGQPVIFGASNFQQGAYLNSQVSSKDLNLFVYLIFYRFRKHTLFNKDRP
jgi:hypothetical protein